MFRAPAFCVLGAETLNLPKIPLQNPLHLLENARIWWNFLPGCAILRFDIPGQGQSTRL